VPFEELFGGACVESEPLIRLASRSPIRRKVDEDDRSLG
jgi:hypothetical protein